MIDRIEKILEFWFGTFPNAWTGDTSRHDMWFRNGAAYDAEIFSSFGSDYFRAVDLGDGDSFVIQVLHDGAVETSIIPLPGTSGFRTVSLGDDFDSGGQVQVRLRLTSDASDEADGVHMDDIHVLCHGSPSDDGYEFLDGTSMATPMVSGAAGLLFSQYPSLTPSEVKAALYGEARKPKVVSFVSGIGGRDISPEGFEEIINRGITISEKGSPNEYEIFGVRE